MAAPTIGPDGNLQGTLDATRAVTAEIQKASDQAAVIGTVLAKELPDEFQVADVAQAIEQTGELEQKLSDSADQLAEVSEALAQEIAKRQAVSKKLEASREEVERLSSEVQNPTGS
jgi:DNA repair ATPase RecN